MRQYFSCYCYSLLASYKWVFTTSIYNCYLILDVPPKKPSVVTNTMTINTAKTNPPVTAKPTPVVSTATSLPTTNGNISSNLFD